MLVLTARRSDLDQVALLEMGADDFVTKPIDPRVLFARIKAHLRRAAQKPAGGPAPMVLELGPLVLDRVRRRATWGDTSLDLTGLELDLLWTLGTAAGQVVPRDVLYERVLGVRYDGLDRGVDSHVSHRRPPARRSHRGGSATDADLRTPSVVRQGTGASMGGGGTLDTQTRWVHFGDLRPGKPRTRR